jgi:sigma-B regulation protein RsbU (phosphoserine phosphatase)
VQAEVSASSLELPHGNYMIALVRDISERKAVQDELRRANERMHADLQAAAEIQRSLLPTRSHLLRGVRIGWDFKPSELLAGDLLNIFRLDEDHIGMYVLDVSGHGVRAAMHSLSLNRALSPYAGPTSLLLHQNDWESSEIVPPGQVATELSRAFPFDPETGQFVTLLYGVLNRRTREFRFVSAGHCAPVYVPPGGEPREIEEYGFPIGIVPERPYEDHTITLEPGGRLYLYSDGLTEAMDGKGDLFDRERLLAAIAGAKDVALEESIGRVMSAVEAWSCDTCPRDDMTLLGVELHE